MELRSDFVTPSESARSTLAIGSRLARRIAVLAALLGARALFAATVEPEDLAELTLEELGHVEITSVSRHAQGLDEAPASVFVITREEILLSGARTLPEALRLAPNLQVARTSASQYAISARGFNNSLGNKLLVLIDGRTVYTPLFSGVFWDAQDVLVEDVARIEVISGPGAVIWGANAVNGVINIITLPAGSSRGGFVGASGNGDGFGLAARYGGKIGKATDYRVYAKRDRTAATEGSGGAELTDEWDTQQGGFWADWTSTSGVLTVQGDAYRGEGGERPVAGPLEISGSNLLARWSKEGAGGSSLRLQVYYDRTERTDRFTFEETLDVIDLDFSYGFERGRHRIVWGGGARHANDDTERGLLVAFIPAQRTLDWANLYLQDEWFLGERFELTLGGRLDRNDFTGIEFLPNVRLAWKPQPGRLLWGAISRAVRAPSRIDTEFYFPADPPYLIRGGPDFESEVSNVFELGYRAAPTARSSISITAFHHVHDKLRSGQPAPGGGFFVENHIVGSTSGVEGWASYQASPRWRLTGGFLELSKDLHPERGIVDPAGPSDLGNDPKHQLQLRSSLRLAESMDLDLMVRYVSALPRPEVDAYTAVDARFGWRILSSLGISVVGRNLFDTRHTEFAPPALAAQSYFGRELWIRLRWFW